MKRLSALGLALFGCLTAPAALAAATATAEVRNLELWIFDLAPGDGITPTFTIAGSFGTWTSGYLETGASDSDSNGLNLSSSVTSALASAGATLVGGASLGDFVMTSSASSSGSVNANQSDAYAYSYVSFNVTFSSNALLVIAGDAVVSTSGAASAGSWASGTGYVSLSDAGGRHSTGQVGAWSSQGSPDTNNAGRASTSMLNTTGGDLSVWAYGEAYAQVQAAPVPEPGSYAMLLAGLLAIGAVVRRRS